MTVGVLSFVLAACGGATNGDSAGEVGAEAPATDTEPATPATEAVDTEGEAAASDVPEVTVQAVEGSVGGLPFMVIQKEGLDEKHGCAADIQFLASEGAAQNFLMGGEGISVDNDIIGTAIARAEGFEIQAFYPVGNLYLGIVVPEDSPAQDPTDLVGKKIGHFGMDSGTTSFIRVLLDEAYGIDVTQDYEFVEVGPAALPELLASGEIDAMFNFEAFTSKAIVDVPGRWLLKAHEGFEEALGGFAPWITNMVAHTEWLEQNAEAAYCVRDAYDEAVQMLNDSQYQIANDAYYMERLGIEEQAVMDVLLENAASTPYFTTEWSEDTIARANEFLASLAEKDILLEDAPDSDVMTTLEELVDRPS